MIHPRLQRFDLPQPKGGGGIGRHSPVSSGRKAYGSYLGAVRKTGTLELLIEETTEEDAQPVAYSFRGVCAVECVQGQSVDAAGRGAETQCVVKEEIVQFVGAYEIFGFLSDVSVGVGGY